ncbi:MAG TPA: YraN family protein [Bacillota bacterium]|nr:YraN family protein [Bacillota bacterium]
MDKNGEDRRTSKQKAGDRGEDIAAGFLEKQGYRVLYRKYRTRFGEIDIVARKGRVIAFVEVKARKRTDYGLPCEAVDRRKQRRLKLGAEYFLLVNPWCKSLQPRMDIIELLFLERGSYIRHLKNAF